MFYILQKTNRAHIYITLSASLLLTVKGGGAMGLAFAMSACTLVMKTVRVSIQGRAAEDRLYQITTSHVGAPHPYEPAWLYS